MQLNDAIKHILNGDAIILMGSGASFGAKNAFGEFPSGSQLAKYLYKRCDIVPDDEYDLQDAAQCYQEKNSPLALITEIRTLLTCASFSSAHEVIYSLPWLRYYTTNYDDVALFAAKKQGVSITPLTLNHNFREYINYDNLCVHINGHIGNLNEETLHNEFKLTSSSYLAQDNILNSSWGQLLINDLDTAKCIVILGLSLKYDLDLSRIIFNSNSIEKTIIIDTPTLSLNAENRLSRFGNVHKIGVDGFAEAINEIKADYIPKPKDPLKRTYTSFTYEYLKSCVPPSPTPQEVLGLFWGGQFTDSLVHKTDGKYAGLIHRSKSDDIERAIEDGKRFIFIQSDMGNGKTMCINELRYRLSKKNVHVFTLFNPDSSKIKEDISEICTVDNPVLVIIEDYTNFMEIVRIFSSQNIRNIQFVLTARTALNHNKMPEILSTFSVKENESALVDINILSEKDIRHCIHVFNRYGLFGRDSKCSYDEKYQLLSQRKKGNKKFQSIMLHILSSPDMKKRVDDLVKTIKNHSTQYHSAIILVLLVQLMNLRVSTTDIERIVELDVSTDALFRSNPAINELISFGNQTQFSIKAPVTAKYILEKISDPDMIISSLYSLAIYASKYPDIPKFSNILTSIISYSHINSFLRGFSNPDRFLTNYYDRISEIEHYRNNHFFWLQYAISCIEIKDFDRAQQYFDVAYGLTPERFDPFQINNQQARLHLEKIENDAVENALDAFESAHKLLMQPIVSEKDNEHNVVRLFGYYCRKRVKERVTSDDKNRYYELACKEAYSRLSTFIENNPQYFSDFRELKSNLLNAYVES
ncbi:MAG: hypothetical protein FWC13_07045 [Oscillospiraceae bacterium]|nr:hypothetical protein [Oscillospiraceae bacterium]